MKLPITRNIPASTERLTAESAALPVRGVQHEGGSWIHADEALAAGAMAVKRILKQSPDADKRDAADLIAA